MMMALSFLHSLSQEPDEWNEPRFVCERVCTSDKLLNKMGGLSKVRCSSIKVRMPVTQRHAILTHCMLPLVCRIPRQIRASQSAGHQVNGKHGPFGGGWGIQMVQSVTPAAGSSRHDIALVKQHAD